VGNDPDASCSTNREFHLALAAASGNPHLKRFVEMLWMPGIGVTDDEIPTGQASHEVLSPAGDHERILDAVRDNVRRPAEDPVAARVDGRNAGGADLGAAS
jgi:DNA-binding FadR family transcriptional regulator